MVLWVFRLQRFESPLRHAEFIQRLDSIVFKPGFWGAFWFRLYGHVGQDDFDIWCPGGLRTTVTRVLGEIEPEMEQTRDAPPAAHAPDRRVCRVGLPGRDRGTAECRLVVANRVTRYRPLPDRRSHLASTSRMADDN